MIGRTNVGGGTQFTATVNITTDPNATITMVNLAGDVFSGTANASGSLTLVLNKSGTYTVSETGGGVKTLLVIDDGATYSLTIIAFDGTLVAGGIEKVNFMTRAITSSSPSVTYNQTIDGENAIELREASGGIGQYITSDYYSPSDYTFLTVRGYGYQVFVCAVDSVNSTTNLGRLSRQGYPVDTQSFLLSGLDSYKTYRFGLHLTGNTQGYLVNLKLE